MTFSLWGSDVDLIETLNKKLSMTFNIQDLGDLGFSLGIESV